MSIMITTKEELQYVMKFYGIPHINLANERCNDLGQLNQDLSYTPSYIHKFTNVRYAIECAIDIVNTYYNKLKDIKNLLNKTYESRLVYCGETQYFEKRYPWTSDIKKTGIGIINNNEDEMVLIGTAMQMSEFVSYAKEHYMYCHGTTYKLENEELNKDIKFLKTFGVDDNYDIYQIGIVD